MTENETINTLDNGSDKRLYEVYKYHYAADGSQWKTEYESVRTRYDGSNESSYQIHEYDFVLNGTRYETRHYYAYTYTDGSSYWNQTVYEYDFSEGCFRTTTYTNSYGDNSSYRETYHDTSSYYYETIRNSTCTQYGVYKETWRCNRCQQVTSENEYRTVPNDHKWYWHYEKQIYVCDGCGQENINGASGTIILEDLTEAWGNGTDYVVGYWNRGNDLKTLKYVSVILNDVEEGGDIDNEILLDIETKDLMEATESINAVSFNQAETLDAAKSAMEAINYTGSYAIRFTFVPMDEEDTLDYAITFDSLEQ